MAKMRTGRMTSITTAPVPKGYESALNSYKNPRVIESKDNTAYNTYKGTIGRDSKDPNQKQKWWLEHERFHHLQNLSGALHSAGPAGLAPNPLIASDESLKSNDRRTQELESQIDKMISNNPELKFIPREKLSQSTYGEGMNEPGFVGADDLMYADPTTVEGEAREYEQYIRKGGKSIFPGRSNVLVNSFHGRKKNK